MKMLFGLWFGLLVLGISSSSALAQNDISKVVDPAGGLSASGKVVGPTAEPQAGVPVVVEGPTGKTHAFTDADGNWSLYNLSPGTYKVKPAVDDGQLVDFTVKNKGMFSKIFGSDSSAVYTSDIKLNKNYYGSFK
jgi:hypothetical protein